MATDRDRSDPLDYDSFRSEVLDHVQRILERELHSEVSRRYVYSLAFRANDVLPKRDQRPKATTAFQAHHIHRIHSGDEETRETLVQFALVVAEYYDIIDDIVDGDVKPEHEREALLVAQFLVPVLIRLLHRLGERAVDYWTREAVSLIEAPLLHEPSGDDDRSESETYVKLLERQTHLRSSITGLAAVVADASDDAIARAETVGTAVHKLMQFATDLDQYAYDDDPNNAVSHYGREGFFEHFETFRVELDDALDAYPDEHAERMREPWQFDVRAKYAEEMSET